MNFKEMIAADLNDVFFNAEEHAEEVGINGEKMTVIMDNMPLFGAGKSPGEELASDEVLFYIRASEMGHRPQQGREMNFNGRDYIVTFANDYDGMYHIKLQRYRG